jgi:hypothetical protein
MIKERSNHETFVEFSSEVSWNFHLKLSSSESKAQRIFSAWNLTGRAGSNTDEELSMVPQPPDMHRITMEHRFMTNQSSGFANPRGFSSSVLVKISGGPEIDCLFPNNRLLDSGLDIVRDFL